MGWEFSLNDDNVLLLSGVVTAAHSANMLFNTRRAHDMFYKMQVRRAQVLGGPHGFPATYVWGPYQAARGESLF